MGFGYRKLPLSPSPTQNSILNPLRGGAVLGRRRLQGGSGWGGRRVALQPDLQLTKILRAVTLAGQLAHPHQSVEVALGCKCHTWKHGSICCQKGGAVDESVWRAPKWCLIGLQSVTDDRSTDVLGGLHTLQIFL